MEYFRTKISLPFRLEIYRHMLCLPLYRLCVKKTDVGKTDKISTGCSSIHLYDKARSLICRRCVSIDLKKRFENDFVLFTFKMQHKI